MIPHDLLLAVAASFGLSVIQLRSRTRDRYVSHARQAAAWVLRSAFQDLSLEAIGALLGGRDHTTIIWALKAVELRMDSDPVLAARLRALVAPPARASSDRVFWGVTIARTA